MLPEESKIYDWLKWLKEKSAIIKMLTGFSFSNEAAVFYICLK